MNRSILIVICDFLLVSLLAFSTVDINKVSDEGSQRTVKVDIATKQADSRQDLGNVMRLALEEERRGRDMLLGELAKTREAASKQQELLSEKEKQVQTFEQELRTREQQQAQLQQKQKALEQQFSTAQANIQNLNQQLQNTSKEALLSREKAAAIDAEARKQAELAAALQQQLAQLAKSNQLALAEKQQLASQLQLAEAEKRFATEQAARMQEQVKVEREEKAKLAEGVKALANKSGQLAQEIRENRALAPNTIFTQFVTNRVQASLNATRSTLFGIDSNRQKETKTVLVSDGSSTYALCHVQDTPLVFWDPGTEWEGLTGKLAYNKVAFDVGAMWFHHHDPRIVLMPLPETQARQLGCKIYKVSADPFKFQDAVVIGTREDYYGECKFQVDTSTPQYIKMDHNSLKGLFGKFNPSRGDLVFSKTGELLGIMGNSSYCLVLHSFTPGALFKFGNVKDQHTGAALTRLYYYVQGMPMKLQ